jgi:hypothetical protein
MKLEFESQAVVEENLDGVRFVGRYTGANGKDKFVLCRVDRHALEVRESTADCSPTALLAAYKFLGNDIHKIASAQFSGGIEHPQVTAADLQRLRSL